MDHTDFKEARYLEKDWFSTFTLGHDNPGTRNWLDEGEKKLGCAPGWQEQSVEYYINHWRYRGELAPAMGASAAFGCSYTFGYGVNDPYPVLLDAVNCGLSGASNDQIARLAITYCKTFKPSEIYVMWTFKARREYVHETGALEKFRNLSEEAIKEELKSPTWLSSYLTLMNDKSDHYNYQKNKLMLFNFCENNDIVLRQKEITDLPKSLFSLARDNDHPGPDWHTNIAGILCEK
jgi:hypothetical protein